MKHKNKALVSFLSLIMGGILLLSGCSLLPLPDHLRYKRINDVVEQVDYKSIGTILVERYDNGDGVFSPSFFLVEINGELEEYELLESELLKVKNIDCYNIDEGYADCEVGQVQIQARLIDEEGKTYINLVITDVYGGRESD